MNEYVVNLFDERLDDIQRDDFDCFTFDSLSIYELKRILRGKSVLLDRFVLKEEKNTLEYKTKHILSKVRLINNIVKNNPYTKAFLVFQTISWKIKKKKMPFILIPVRIFDEGTKVVKDGEPFINPLLSEHIDDYEFTINSRNLFGLDNSELFSMIEESNGRLIYEMYLTHFKVSYSGQKAKFNKRFVRVEHQFDYSEENNDLLPIDFELINIKKQILEGNNALVNAKQGTKKVALIVNIISECIARNKSLLYISEKNYRSLRDTIQTSGISKHVNDILDTNYKDQFNEIEENPIEFDRLNEMVNQLHAYQDNMTSEYKGFVLSQAFSELVLLEDMKEKILEVDFFDELQQDDVEKIREILSGIERILKQEAFGNPAEQPWNDVDVRNARYKETEMVQAIESVQSILFDITKTVKAVLRDYGIKLPTNFHKLSEYVHNLDYMNSLQYPESWLFDDAFEQAKDQINYANALSGRTLSLHTNIRMVYNNDVFSIDTEDYQQKLFGDYFTDSDTKVMNAIIKSRKHATTELQKLQSEVERLLFFKERYSELLNVELNDDYLDFLQELGRFLLDKNIKVEWLNFTNEKKTDTLSILAKNEGVVSRYMRLQKEVQNFFNDDIEELEQHFVKQYLQYLQNGDKKTTELQSIIQLVEQYTKPKYQNTNKKRKIAVIKSLDEMLDLASEVHYIDGILLDELHKEIKFEDYHEVKSLFDDLLTFEQPYILDFEYKMEEFEKLNNDFLQSKEEYEDSMKESLFSGLSNLTVEELEVELDKYKTQMIQLLNVEEELKTYSLKSQQYLSIQKMKTMLNMVQNYQKNASELEKRSGIYKELFGENYTGMTTMYKGIRVAIKNFEKFLKMFTSVEKAKQYFEKKDYKFVNETLYGLRRKLEQLEERVDDLQIYFTSNIELGSFNRLSKYINQFESKRSLVKWVELMDHLQNLRNYNQMKIASYINNGLTNKKLLDQFNYSFYRSLIREYYKPVNTAKLIQDMHDFNYQNKLVHQQRIIDVRNTRRSKKIMLSNVSGIEAKSKVYDIVIIDGAERIHSSYMTKLLSLGKTALVVFDEFSTNIEDSMLSHMKHQPIYDLQNNYRISPYLIEEEDMGVLFNQEVSVVTMLNVIENVVDTLLHTEKRINVVCLDNRERVEIFNLVNARIMKSAEEVEELVSRLYVLLYEEYIPSADLTYLIVNEENDDLVLHAIKTTLRNSRELVILDEGSFLEETTYVEELIKTQMELFGELMDPLSKHILKKLNCEFSAKRMIYPFDFVIGDGNDIKCLVKITFNNPGNSDILEETLMMFDEEYENVPKLIIPIEDLYFNLDTILRQLKEVIDCGNSEQN